MSIRSRRTRQFLALLCGLVSAARVGAAASTLDDGKLDPAYFGGQAEFREAEDVDYLWVSPGFALDGKKIAFAPWPEPKFLGADAGDRDLKDKRLAEEMNADMPEIWGGAFRRGFGDRITLAEEGADLRVEGRIVDCSAGSNVAKALVGWGAGAGNTTIDLRFVDTSSGEVVAGLHHRVVSGTSWSTTDSKFVNWVDELVETVSKKGFEKLYQKGEKIRK